jgi:hypothetical protein
MAKAPRLTFQIQGVPSSEGTLQVEAGQELRGTLTVETEEELTFLLFLVQLRWGTKGKGNSVSGMGSSVELARDGRWMPGTSKSFPFSLQVPWGPLSYQGEILTVEWELESRLERSFPAKDFQERTPVRVVAAPRMPHFDLGPTPQKERELRASKKGFAGLWLAFGVILMLGGIVFGAAVGWEVEGARGYALLAVLAVGFFMAIRGFWGRLGRGKLGEPTVKLSTRDLRLGEEIQFELVIRPRRKAELRSLNAILECEERVTHGHGQYQTHHRRTVFEEKVVLAEPRVIRPQRGLRKQGALTIPGDGPVTFGAPSNRVVWWLRFEADIVGWPDWKDPLLLTVRP